MNNKPLIHVVDDDESLRTALMRLLRAADLDAQGYASTGEFLLQAPPERPGCVLLDLRLPGPSGLDLQAALPSKGITLPVVFMTGHPDVASSVRAMKAGAVDFLEKPVERQTLFEALERAEQCVALDRLGQEVHRAGLHRPHAGGHVGMTRQKDHRQRDALALQGRLQLEPRRTRHA